MITIDKHDYVNKVNDYARMYGRKILEQLHCTSSYVDPQYAKDTINGLDTFAACIRKQCLHDMSVFKQDVAAGFRLLDDYESFGDYAYEMLKQCFDATNEVLSCNNKLQTELRSKLHIDISDLSVTSNFIGLNVFSGIAKLELRNFQFMNGVGLSYDMHLLGKTVQTMNVVERIRPQLKYYVELAAFIEALEFDDVKNLLIEWTTLANGPLLQKKLSADLAWHVTYACMKQAIDNAAFNKQVGYSLCSMHSADSHFTETLYCNGVTKTVDWGIDRAKMLQLDYINNLNFQFVDSI